MFSGALVRMGKELGISMPYNEYTYHMIKALEEKKDGRFDYTGKDTSWI
jgi:2-dehydropantoate 2-reductase